VCGERSYYWNEADDSLSLQPPEEGVSCEETEELGDFQEVYKEL